VARYSTVFVFDLIGRWISFPVSDRLTTILDVCLVSVSKT